MFNVAISLLTHFPCFMIEIPGTISLLICFPCYMFQLVRLFSLFGGLVQSYNLSAYIFSMFCDRHPRLTLPTHPFSFIDKKMFHQSVYFPCLVATFNSTIYVLTYFPWLLTEIHDTISLPIRFP